MKHLNAAFLAALFLASSTAQAMIPDGFWCRPLKNEPPYASTQLIACGKDPGKQAVVCSQRVECTFVTKEENEALKAEEAAEEKRIRDAAKTQDSAMTGPSDPSPEITELQVQHYKSSAQLHQFARQDWVPTVVTCEAQAVADIDGKKAVLCPNATQCARGTAAQVLKASTAVGGVIGGEKFGPGAPKAPAPGAGGAE